ncbi:hypothetical protein Y032_0101g3405 [Ancylostoma ceylanicum]|nr:hypothetical protein Y032_0101g3405 [Ancylostoma ceylanicum]
MVRLLTGSMAVEIQETIFSSCASNSITRCHDDGSDADLWRESTFSLWSRPVRYLAISREIPEATIRGTVSVVTDITVVKETDPIPHGFIAIDYCADSL